MRKSVATVFVVTHRSVVEMSETMLLEMRRHNYVTPTNYLELVSGYKKYDYTCVYMYIHVHVHVHVYAISKLHVHMYNTCTHSTVHVYPLFCQPFLIRKD